MASSLMTQTQRRLDPGMALRLAATGRARHLRVREGRVWLTVTGGGLPDVWLSAGDEMALAPGAEVVVEGWPSARFELIEAVPVPAHNRDHVRVPPVYRPAT